MSKDKYSAEEVVLEVMRHFGYRRNYQVAEYFDVTPQTLSGWIKSGEIPLRHLIKFNEEIRPIVNEEKRKQSKDQIVDDIKLESTFIKLSPAKIKRLLLLHIKTIILVPVTVTLLTSFYLFFIAAPVYVSNAKVLPVSEDGSSSNSFSGIASQLGISMPLSIGGRIPWDEIYPEIAKSNDLINFLLNNTFETKKYGNQKLLDLVIKEYNLRENSEQKIITRAITELHKRIHVTKNRLSPIITVSIESFEPLLAVNIAKNLIEESSKIQRRLKTNRIQQKRIFIQERMDQVFKELDDKEQQLREFRENNRNMTSPSQQMRVQEMGRDIDLQSALYVTLKSQYEKAKIDEVEKEDMVQLIDGPTLPITLTRPRRGLGIGLAFMFGIFLSIFIIYFKENLVEMD